MLSVLYVVLLAAALAVVGYLVISPPRGRRSGKTGRARSGSPLGEATVTRHQQVADKGKDTGVFRAHRYFDDLDALNASGGKRRRPPSMSAEERKKADLKRLENRLTMEMGTSSPPDHWQAVDERPKVGDTAATPTRFGSHGTENVITWDDHSSYFRSRASDPSAASGQPGTSRVQPPPIPPRSRVTDVTPRGERQSPVANEIGRAEREGWGKSDVHGMPSRQGAPAIAVNDAELPTAARTLRTPSPGAREAQDVPRPAITPQSGSRFTGDQAAVASPPRPPKESKYSIPGSTTRGESIYPEASRGERRKEVKLKLFDHRKAQTHEESFSPYTHPVKSAEFVYERAPSKAPVKCNGYFSGLKEVDDRLLGAMIGSVMGDAYGAPFEGSSKLDVSQLSQISDDHSLPGRLSGRHGAWTHDTAMALCVLASLLEKGIFDPKDLFEKYKDLYYKKYMNFDAKIASFAKTTELAISDEFIDNKVQPSWGNAVIVRLVPIAIAYLFSEDETALLVAAASGGMTSGDQGALDFTAFLMYVMRILIRGSATREDVCKADFPEKYLGWYWDKYPYGKFFRKFVAHYPNAIDVTEPYEELSSHICLSRAIHVFCQGDDYMTALKKIVGYGGDTDTTCAIFSQLYGSYYGMANYNRTPGGVGLEKMKIYQTTERIDAISELTKCLIDKALNAYPRRHSCWLIDEYDGKVKVMDINPHYILPNMKDVKDVSVEHIKKGRPKTIKTHSSRFTQQQPVPVQAHTVSGLSESLQLRIGPGKLNGQQREEKRTKGLVAGMMHRQAFSTSSDPLESAHFIYDKIGVKEPTVIQPLPQYGKELKEIVDRFIAAMLGLAMGDAYGSAYEFMTPERVAELEPADDHKHPGHFSKRLGAWTDDTSMALCLLASALEKKKFDPEDVFEKYQRWYKDRYMNFDAKYTDVGDTTRTVLDTRSINIVEQPSWGNGVIMRIAPVAMLHTFSRNTADTLRIAAASGGMTAGDQGALDFPAFLVYILLGFIRGNLSKEDVCKKEFPETHLGWYWDEFPYGEHFAKFVSSYPEPVEPKILAEQLSSHLCLSRAIHVFCTEPSFPRALKKIVGYGHDTDTSAAIFGQLYGAYYGLENLKRLDWPKAKGLQNEKLYKSTDRIDAIRDLCKELWNHLTSTKSDPPCPLIGSDGKVQDINPSRKLPPPYQEVEDATEVDA